MMILGVSKQVRSVFYSDYLLKDHERATFTTTGPNNETNDNQ